MKIKLSFVAVFYVFMFLFPFSIALGQEATSPKKWNYLGELYLMFPNMKGEIGVGNLPNIELDAESNDILGQLKFGAMMYFEANTDKWAISSDLLYMKLGMGASDHKTITSGEAIVEQLAWELAGLRKINTWLDLGVGARLVYLYTGLELQTINNQTKSASISKTWVDPVLIMRSQNYFNEKLFYQFRGDIGGFGLGSDFSWQIQANIGYRFSKLFQSSIGYRYIGVDYDKGEGSDRFLYDVDTFGPVMRLGFNF